MLLFILWISRIRFAIASPIPLPFSLLLESSPLTKVSQSSSDFLSGRRSTEFEITSSFFVPSTTISPPSFTYLTELDTRYSRAFEISYLLTFLKNVPVIFKDIFLSSRAGLYFSNNSFVSTTISAFSFLLTDFISCNCKSLRFPFISLSI